MKLTIILALVPMFGFGMDRLSALASIETGNNDRMIGKAGEISRYQILKREWHSVTKSTRYTNPAVAKTVALRLLNKRIDAFHDAHKRPPTHFEFYALWNAPTQALQGCISPRVAQRCRRFANLCQLN